LYVKPRRFRIILAFLLGLGISVALLTAGYLYYRSNLGRLESEIKARAMEEARQAFNEEYPMSLVYVFGTDKKAGETIEDTDLVPAEINAEVIPGDAVLLVEEAAGKVMRCDISKNTVVTRSLFYSEEDFPDDMRMMEYSVINIPTRLEAGSFIDVRIMFPNGLDYIVLSKKKVLDLQKEEGRDTGIISFYMTEEEILRMSSAIVDASLVDGTKIYAVQYVAPDIQKEAAMTYPVNFKVMELIDADPNILSNAVRTLEARNRKNLEKRMNEDLVLSGKLPAFSDAGSYEPIQEKTPETASSDEVPEPEPAGDYNSSL